MRLIDADTFIEKLNKFKTDTYASAECYVSVTEIVEAIEYVGISIDETPTVEAKEVVHGKWIHDTNNLYGCSECMNRETMSAKSMKNFCPNCGADMRKEVQNER